MFVFITKLPLLTSCGKIMKPTLMGLLRVDSFVPNRTEQLTGDSCYPSTDGSTEWRRLLSLNRTGAVKWRQLLSLDRWVHRVETVAFPGQNKRGFIDLSYASSRNYFRNILF
jgi:hypothetical protein